MRCGRDVDTDKVDQCSRSANEEGDFSGSTENSRKDDDA